MTQSKLSTTAKVGVTVMALMGSLLPSANLNAASNGAESTLKKCLYVSSYHKGYDWSDGVEEGVRNTLAGKCSLRQIDMDTKRKKTTDEKVEAANAVVDLIASWKPDVVITSDDNAAKYVIVPHFKDSSIPIVFSGINWTVEEYGFPYKNVTGIVEVAPIEPMLQKAVTLSKGTEAIYIGADTLTEEKNFSRISSDAERLGITLHKKLVSSFSQWLDAYNHAQRANFIVMGSNSGITGWDEDAAMAHAKKSSRKLTVTNHAWMMQVSTLGFTKIPQEHGEWAAEAGLAILDGIEPEQIPIVTNRKWELWMNNALIEKAKISVPLNLSRKAKRIAEAN